eukprot:192370-Ditylum_brightwellii.AAC.1
MLRAPVLVNDYNRNSEDDINADYNNDSDDGLRQQRANSSIPYMKGSRATHTYRTKMVTMSVMQHLTDEDYWKAWQCDAISYSNFKI